MADLLNVMAASEVEAPELMITQNREEESNDEQIGSKKDEHQTLVNLGVSEGNRQSTDGECFLYPPTVVTVACEDKNRVSEEYIPEAQVRAEDTLLESSDQQHDINKPEGMEKVKENITVNPSLYVQGEEFSEPFQIKDTSTADIATSFIESDQVLISKTMMDEINNASNSLVENLEHETRDDDKFLQCDMVIQKEDNVEEKTLLPETEAETTRKGILGEEKPENGNPEETTKVNGLVSEQKLLQHVQSLDSERDVSAEDSIGQETGIPEDSTEVYLKEDITGILDSGLPKNENDSVKKEDENQESNSKIEMMKQDEQRIESSDERVPSERAFEVSDKFTSSEGKADDKATEMGESEDKKSVSESLESESMEVNMGMKDSESGLQKSEAATDDKEELAEDTPTEADISIKTGAEEIQKNLAGLNPDVDESEICLEDQEQSTEENSENSISTSQQDVNESEEHTPEKSDTKDSETQEMVNDLDKIDRNLQQETNQNMAEDRTSEETAEGIRDDIEENLSPEKIEELERSTSFETAGLEQTNEILTVDKTLDSSMQKIDRNLGGNDQILPPTESLIEENAIKLHSSQTSEKVDEAPEPKVIEDKNPITSTESHGHVEQTPLQESEPSEALEVCNGEENETVPVGTSEMERKELQEEENSTQSSTNETIKSEEAATDQHDKDEGCTIKKASLEESGIITEEASAEELIEEGLTFVNRTTEESTEQVEVELTEAEKEEVIKERSENDLIVEETNESPLDNNSIEKELENKEASSKIEPIEEDTEQRKISSEETICEEQPSEPNNSTEFVLSEGNVDEESTAKAINLVTEETKEEKCEETLQSQREKIEEIHNTEELTEINTDMNATPSDQQESGADGEGKNESTEDTPTGINIPQQTDIQTIQQSYPSLNTEVNECICNDDQEEHHEEHINSRDFVIEKNTEADSTEDITGIFYGGLSEIENDSVKKEDQNQEPNSSNETIKEDKQERIEPSNERVPNERAFEVSHKFTSSEGKADDKATEMGESEDKKSASENLESESEKKEEINSSEESTDVNMGMNASENGLQKSKAAGDEKEELAEDIPSEDEISEETRAEEIKKNIAGLNPDVDKSEICDEEKEQDTEKNSESIISTSEKETNVSLITEEHTQEKTNMQDSETQNLVKHLDEIDRNIQQETNQNMGEDRIIEETAEDVKDEIDETLSPEKTEELETSDSPENTGPEQNNESLILDGTPDSSMQMIDESLGGDDLILPPTESLIEKNAIELDSSQGSEKIDEAPEPKFTQEKSQIISTESHGYVEQTPLPESHGYALEVCNVEENETVLMGTLEMEIKELQEEENSTGTITKEASAEELIEEDLTLVNQIREESTEQVDVESTEPEVEVIKESSQNDIIAEEKNESPLVNDSIESEKENQEASSKFEPIEKDTEQREISSEDSICEERPSEPRKSTEFMALVGNVDEEATAKEINLVTDETKEEKCEETLKSQPEKIEEIDNSKELTQIHTDMNATPSDQQKSGADVMCGAGEEKDESTEDAPIDVSIPQQTEFQTTQQSFPSLNPEVNESICNDDQEEQSEEHIKSRDFTEKEKNEPTFSEEAGNIQQHTNQCMAEEIVDSAEDETHEKLSTEKIEDNETSPSLETIGLEQSNENLNKDDILDSSIQMTEVSPIEENAEELISSVAEKVEDSLQQLKSEEHSPIASTEIDSNSNQTVSEICDEEEQEAVPTENSELSTEAPKEEVKQNYTEILENITLNNGEAIDVTAQEKRDEKHNFEKEALEESEVKSEEKQDFTPNATMVDSIEELAEESVTQRQQIIEEITKNVEETIEPAKGDATEESTSEDIAAAEIVQKNMEFSTFNSEAEKKENILEKKVHDAENSPSDHEDEVIINTSNVYSKEEEVTEVVNKKAQSTEPEAAEEDFRNVIETEILDDEEKGKVLDQDFSQKLDERITAESNVAENQKDGEEADECTTSNEIRATETVKDEMTANHEFEKCDSETTRNEEAIEESKCYTEDANISNDEFQIGVQEETMIDKQIENADDSSNKKIDGISSRENLKQAEVVDDADDYCIISAEADKSETGEISKAVESEDDKSTEHLLQEEDITNKHLGSSGMAIELDKELQLDEETESIIKETIDKDLQVADDENVEDSNVDHQSSPSRLDNAEVQKNEEDSDQIVDEEGKISSSGEDSSPRHDEKNESDIAEDYSQQHDEKNESDIAEIQKDREEVLECSGFKEIYVTDTLKDEEMVNNELGMSNSNSSIGGAIEASPAHHESVNIFNDNVQLGVQEVKASENQPKNAEDDSNMAASIFAEENPEPNETLETHEHGTNPVAEFDSTIKSDEVDKSALEESSKDVEYPDATEYLYQEHNDIEDSVNNEVDANQNAEPANTFDKLDSDTSAINENSPSSEAEETKDNQEEPKVEYVEETRNAKQETVEENFQNETAGKLGDDCNREDASASGESNQIHETKIAKDDAIVEDSDSNNAIRNEEHIEASPSQDENANASNNEIHVIGDQEETKTEEQPETMNDENPTNLVEAVSIDMEAKELKPNVETQSITKEATKEDFQRIANDEVKITSEESSEVVNQHAYSDNRFLLEGSREDEDCLNTEGDLKQATNELDNGTETESIRNEAAGEGSQQVVDDKEEIMDGNSEPPLQPEENNTAEIEHSELQVESSEIHGTENVLSKEIMIHEFEQSNGGQNQEHVETSTPSIDAKDHVPNKDKVAVVTQGIEVAEAQEEAVGEVEHDSSQEDNPVKFTDNVSGEENFKNPECGSELTKLLEVNKAEEEATSRDVNPLEASSTENQTGHSYIEAKTLSTEGKETSFVKCATDSKEDADKSSEEEHIREESQNVPKTGPAEEDLQKALTDETLKCKLENEEITYIPDAEQIHAVEIKNEQCKFFEMDRSELNKEIMNQGLQTEILCDEVRNQQSSVSVEASGENIGDENGTLSQNECPKISNDQTQVDQVKETKEKNAKSQTHENIDTASEAVVKHDELLGPAESQLSGDAVTIQFDIPKENVKEEEKEEVNYGEVKLTSIPTAEKTGSLEDPSEGDILKALGASPAKETEVAEDDVEKIELRNASVEEIKTVGLLEQEQESRDLASTAMKANQTAAECELDNIQAELNTATSTNEKEDRLNQPSSEQIETKYEESSKDNEENTTDIQLQKEEKSEDKFFKTEVQEIESELKVSTEDSQIKEELVEEKGKTSEPSNAKTQYMSSDCLGINVPPESDLDRDIDGSSQRIIEDNEIQLSNSTEQTSNMSLRNDSSNRQVQTEGSDKVLELYGQESIRSEEAVKNKHHNAAINEHILKESQCKINFEGNDDTICDTNEEENIGSAGSLMELESSSELVIAGEKHTEHAEEEVAKNEETSAEVKGHEANSVENQYSIDINRNAIKLDECSMEKTEDAEKVTTKVTSNEESNRIVNEDTTDGQAFHEVQSMVTELETSDLLWERNSLHLENIEAQDMDAKSNTQSQDEPVEISSYRTEIIEANDMAASDISTILHNVSAEEVKYMNEPISTGKTEEVCMKVENSNAVNAEGEEQVSKNEGRETNNLLIQDKSLKEMMEQVECLDNVPHVENITLVIEQGTKETHPQRNFEKALDISSTMEAEQTDDGKPFSHKVEQLSAKEAEETIRITQQEDEARDMALAEKDVNQPAHVEELTAADIIASQISQAIEEEEQRQQQTSAQLKEELENDKPLTAMEGNTSSNQVLKAEDKNYTSLEETTNQAILPEGRGRELELQKDWQPKQETEQKIERTDELHRPETKDLSSEIEGADFNLENEAKKVLTSFAEIMNEKKIKDLNDSEETSKISPLNDTSHFISEESHANSCSAASDNSTQNASLEKVPTIPAEAWAELEETDLQNHHKAVNDGLTADVNSELTSADPATINDDITEEAAGHTAVQGEIQVSSYHETKAQCDHKNELVTPRSSEKEEMQTFARKIEVLNEKVLNNQQITDLPDKAEKTIPKDEERRMDVCDSLVSGQKETDINGKVSSLLDIPKTQASITAPKTPEAIEERKTRILTDDFDSPTEPTNPAPPLNGTEILFVEKCADNMNERPSKIAMENQQGTDWPVRTEEKEDKGRQATLQMESNKMFDNTEIPYELGDGKVEENNDKLQLSSEMKDQCSNVSLKENVEELADASLNKRLPENATKGVSEEHHETGSCPNQITSIIKLEGKEVAALQPVEPLKETLQRLEANESSTRTNEIDETKARSMQVDSSIITARTSQIDGSITQKGEQNIPMEETPSERERMAETDDEKDDSVDQTQEELQCEIPITAVALGEIELKAAQKKSHNILSGVGSKMKHSISKMKKAIACSSAQFSQEDVIVKLNKNKKV